MNKSGKLTTEFATAERAAPETVIKQAGLVGGTLCNPKLLDAGPALLTVLNEQRQIVYANTNMLKFTAAADEDIVLGKRPGEALGCTHASESAAGCGTTAFCSTCGAARAILSALNGRKDVQECRILKTNGDALDLRVWTTPLEADGEKYTVCAMLDIADEKRRRALERIFFHDILNVAAGLRGFAELSATAAPADSGSFQTMIRELAAKLIEDIQAQRDLANAENNDLLLKTSTLHSRALLLEVADMYKQLPAANGVAIVVATAAADVAFTSDKLVLRRVMGNMLKNALEASKPGDSVTLNCRANGEDAEFSVHNPAVIPREAQLQLFQRSFSTKGPDRGLGTYSIKLLAERYLKGAVSFESNEANGTTFRVRLPLELPPAPD